MGTRICPECGGLKLNFYARVCGPCYHLNRRGKKRYPDLDRFWKKVLKTESCWLWQASRDACGYGAFWLNNVVMPASRASYILFRGPIPEGLYVLHTCDNPSCVNPDHLIVGSQTDNMQDCVKKGRKHMPAGHEHYLAKLTKEQVVKIRELSVSGLYTQKHIGQLMGIAQPTVSAVVVRRTYKNVP